MDIIQKRLPLFLLPDPVTGPEMLSGAAFLYFKQPLHFTTPPVIITQNSYALLPLIEERKPEWSNIFFSLFGSWREQNDEARKMFDAITPLKQQFKIVWLSYPAGSEALENSNSLIASSGLSLDTVADIIDPFLASGEIMRHIMLEMFLQLNENIEALYNYCGNLFRGQPIQHLLTKGYFLRVQFLARIRQGPVLLTNQNLSQFLDKLPIETEAQPSEEIDNDVIAWELFRQILSPRLDPLNAERAKYIAKLLKSHKGEVERLRMKCHTLANEVSKSKTLQELPNKIEGLVRNQVEREISELLQLDRQTLEAFLTSIFTDEKTWLAVLAFISSVATDHVYVTTGAAIAALSSISAKSFKAAADRRQKLKQNDYALVYTISRKAF